jgi:hypothetical protein
MFKELDVSTKTGEKLKIFASKKESATFWSVLQIKLVGQHLGTLEKVGKLQKINWNSSLKAPEIASKCTCK